MLWPSPLDGYQSAEPLPTTTNPDGKSLYNPPAPQSNAYHHFQKPIDSSNNGFDFHGQLTSSQWQPVSLLCEY
jgi:DOPA 4,5-dioxygenase